MKKVKVIQIGLGHDHAAVILDSLLSQPEVFEVAAFAVPPEEEAAFAGRIREFRDGRGLPFLPAEKALSLPGLDGAVIETEEWNLTGYAQRAAELGLHLHMDKPGGTDPAGFERLVSTVKEKKLVFSLGYMYRFNPKILEALDKVSRGELGEIYAVEAHMDCEHPPEKRQWLSRFPGGMMFYLGCHLIDLIYRIQGEPLEILPLNCSTGFEDVTADDYAMVAYRYPHGISFAKACANEPGGYLRRQLVLCGSRGTIELRPLEAPFSGEDPRHTMYTPMQEAYRGKTWYDAPEVTASKGFNRYDAMMKNFAEMMLGKTKKPYSYDYELALYRLLLRSCGAEGNL